jgi:hypothetical protein
MPKKILKHHRPSVPLRPDNRRRLQEEIARRVEVLLQQGYPEDEAQYLAEKQILPRFFITPATDLRQEREISLLKEQVLQNLADIYSLKRVLRKYNIPRSQFTYWMNNDPEFARAFMEVEMDWGDDLEEEAINRAISGGSDSLLIMLLKGHRQRYRTPPASISASANSSSDAQAFGGNTEAVLNALPTAKFSLAKKLESMALAQATRQQIAPPDKLQLSAPGEAES